MAKLPAKIATVFHLMPSGKSSPAAEKLTADPAPTLHRHLSKSLSIFVLRLEEPRPKSAPGADIYIFLGIPFFSLVWEYLRANDFKPFARA